VFSIIGYPIDTNLWHKQGIAAILSGTGAASFHEKSEEEKEYLLRRSRVFYFNRYVSIGALVVLTQLIYIRITGYSLTVEETIKYEQTLRDYRIPTGVPDVSPPPDPPAGSTVETSNEPRVLTFAELKDFIEQGKTDQIPNNRIIPNVLNVRNIITTSQVFCLSMICPRRAFRVNRLPQQGKSLGSGMTSRCKM
jgi:hypothetical protein